MTDGPEALRQDEGLKLHQKKLYDAKSEHKGDISPQRRKNFRLKKLSPEMNGRVHNELFNLR